jgi:hypothetical protein
MNDKALKGSITELKVATELLTRGYGVYSPVIQNGPVDCVIETSRGFKKIQIKRARKKNSVSNNYFVPIIAGRTRCNYGEFDIDYIIAEINERFFIMERSEFGNKKNQCLSINHCEGTWFKIPPPREPLFVVKDTEEGNQASLLG